GITIAALLLGFIAEPAFAPLLESGLARIVGESAAPGLSVLVALMIATVFAMVVGELVPKNLAIARPERTAKMLATPFRLYGWIARPFIWLSDAVAIWLTRGLGVEPAHELNRVPSLEDLDFLVRSSGAEGTLHPNEVSLVTRSLRFGEKSADEVMVPRIDVHALAADASVANLVEMSAETGLSRFPITRGDIDNVAGVVHVKAALAIDPERRAGARVTGVMRDVLAVPESRDLVSIMIDMRRRRLPLAIVVDEHGGTAGIVSMEDLLEEIVGEIDDEYDDPTELTVVENEGVYVLSGGMHHDEVHDACGFEMPEGRYETLAGFVLDRLQRIPVEGEIFRYDSWRFEVLEMDRRRIESLRLREPWASVQARLRRSRDVAR
ncbi:MAG: hemolysin family protein, partial [Acidimicrobiales bacterium]